MREEKRKTRKDLGTWDTERRAEYWQSTAPGTGRAGSVGVRYGNADTQPRRGSDTMVVGYKDER